MFVTAGINSHFTVCGMFCRSKTKLPNSVSFSCWAQLFVHVPPSLFNVFCSLSPLVPHCSVSSPPLPLSLETHGGKSKRKLSSYPFTALRPLACSCFPLPPANTAISSIALYESWCRTSGTQWPRGEASIPASCCIACPLGMTVGLASVTNKTAPCPAKSLGHFIQKKV